MEKHGWNGRGGGGGYEKDILPEDLWVDKTDDIISEFEKST